MGSSLHHVRPFVERRIDLGSLAGGLSVHRFMVSEKVVVQRPAVKVELAFFLATNPPQGTGVLPEHALFPLGRVLDVLQFPPSRWPDVPGVGERPSSPQRT